MAAAETIYQVWQTRNSLSFDQKTPENDIAKHIQFDVILRA